MLSILLILPILSMVTIYFLNSPRTILLVALVYSILSTLQTYHLMLLFDTENASLFQFSEFAGLIAIDGLSLWLIWLVTMLMPLVLLSAYKSLPGSPYKESNYHETEIETEIGTRASTGRGIDTDTDTDTDTERGRDRVKDRVRGSSGSLIKQAYILLIFIGFWSIAVFMVQNIVLFYISFEGGLIPLYLMILHYGSRNKKIYASYLFFIYTLIGSLSLFVALLGLYIETGTGDYQILLMNRNFIDSSYPIYEHIIWIAFFICFAIKLPIIGFHGWLIAAHVEANTTASVLLAAIMLKMGSYGLIRYSIPLFPYATEYFRPLVLVICIISIIYASLAALSQADMKMVIAYSSVAHMGTSTLGLFSNDYLGIMGGIYGLISHGLISAALFLLVGVLYDRHHSRNVLYYRGLVQIYPTYVLLLASFSMANSAIPLSAGFISEFLSLLGAFHYNPYSALLASLSIILVPSFMLKLLHSIAYGSLTKYLPSLASDITYKEFMIFLPLVFFTLLLGIYPQFLLDYALEPSINLLSK